MRKIKMLFNDDEAVSPVIGVILMVAITVILAAVIGAFVLDLGSNQSASANAGVSFSEPSTDNVEVTVNDPGNVDSLTITGDVDSDTSIDPSAGETKTVLVSNTGSTGTVQVVGTVDGEEQVIQSYDYDFG